MNTSNPSHLVYARVAGFTFLFYIAAGMTSLSLGSESQLADLLYFLQNLSALVLGVTLYLLTREHGPALALLALTCRIMEAIHSESEIFFAVGSLLFCILLLRGRVIPAGLAWLGVIASALLVVILPLQLAGVLAGAGWASSVTWMIWMPMLVFELGVSLWFLFKGVNEPRIAAAAQTNQL
ncbi:MAG: hypothetical protein DPW18_12105 [Chloroflexi bacterium]|nr:hypothetical protein [Chloroflexota bacterium]MDL1944418.1 DUF4386 family protein [Chloroflexi bacterium CFX2]